MKRQLLIVGMLSLCLGLLTGSLRAAPQSAKDVPSDWLSGAMEQIRQAEYSCSMDADGGCSAPNRAQNLRTRFSRDGIVVVPRTEESAQWRLSLTLAGVGRGDRIEKAAAVQPTSKKNRVEFHRGRVTEWYLNDERGLEQGFTLYAPPAGETDDPVVVVIRILSTLVPVVSSDNQAVAFKDSQGDTVVHYSGLMVVDAHGGKLHSQLELVDNEIRIRVRDEGAVYPVIVDPILKTSFKTALGSVATAQLGFSVATAGDLNGDGFSDIAVGAPEFDGGQTNEGIVIVYKGGASAPPFQWTSIEGNLVGARFGTSVSTAGDVDNDGRDDLIVGAPSYNALGDQFGRVYVYYGQETYGIVQSIHWRADGDLEFGRLGSSVAWAGDVNDDGFADILVSQTGYPEIGVCRGRVFAWYGGSGGLGAFGTASNADWVEEGAQDGECFGVSVAAAGDVNGDGAGDVVIGANGYDNGETDEGAARVYLGSGSSGLSTSPDWTAEGGETGAAFGSSVATAGDVDGDGYADILVGAPMASIGGRVFLYGGTAGGPTTSAAWQAASIDAGSKFGHSVSTAGDVNGDGYAEVVIGAPLYSSGQPDEGKVFAWFGGSGGLGVNGTTDPNPLDPLLAQTYDWSPSEHNQATAECGASVATAGDFNGDGFSDVIVGEPKWDQSGLSNRGRFDVYLGKPDGLSTTPRSWQTGNTGAHVGASVASAGDVNADGYGDVIVGAPDYDHVSEGAGAAIIFHGTADGIELINEHYLFGDQLNGAFGSAVAGAGDVNGDGFSDVIVGAPKYDNPGDFCSLPVPCFDGGRVSVFYGATAMSDIPDWEAHIDLGWALFGGSVSSAGDVNGDGFADVLIGSPGYGAEQETDSQNGQAFAWYGGPTGLGADGDGFNFDWYFHTTFPCDSAILGASVASAGDVNRDGVSDVIIGAPDYSCGGLDGGAFVIHGILGSGLPGPTTSDWFATAGTGGSSYLGYSVAGAGDVNGDGYSDVIIGSPQYSAPQGYEGGVFVWHGSASGVNGNIDGIAANTSGTAKPAWRAEGNLASGQFGWSVASAGDVNSDGYSDVIIGAPYFNQSYTGGAAFVWYGGSSGVNAGIAGSAYGTPNYAWYRTGEEFAVEFGYSVGSAGDTNGDGYVDVVVGTRAWTDWENGRVSVYFGNGGDGLQRFPRQGRHGSSAAIDLLGKTYGDGDKFRILGRGRTAAGRDSVKLEYEVVLLETPFVGSGLKTPLDPVVWQDTGAPVSGSGSFFDFNVNHTVSTLNTTYRWQQRVLGKSPFFPRSPWFTLPYNSRNESDLRAKAD